MSRAGATEEREPALTLWLPCLLAPTVQKSAAEQVTLKGPGTTAKIRVDGDRGKREEGGKGQFVFEKGTGLQAHLRFVWF